MARKKPNTNFRLGLDRAELIEAAQMFGKKLKTAKKDSTKRLEEYLVNKLGGKGTKVPTFNKTEKQDVIDHTKTYGLLDGIDLVRYRLERANSGRRDESNYLRLSIRRSFHAFYTGAITDEHLNEIVGRMSHLDHYQMLDGLYHGKPYVTEILREYGDELKEADEKQKE